LHTIKTFVIVIVAGFVLVGCSVDDRPRAEGLMVALSRVQATAETQISVEYGAPGRIQQLLNQDESRYRPLRGYGYGLVANYTTQVEDALGFDLDSFDDALVVGEPPSWGAALWGPYDVAAVEGKLRGLDIRDRAEGGGRWWTSGPDYEIDLTGGPFSEVVGTNEFNNIRTASDSFAFAPAGVGIEWVTRPGQRSLAEDDVIAPLARCLGDVVVARIAGVGEAVGVRGDGTEVACVMAELGAVERALDGDVPSSGEPWESVLPGASVDRDGELVRVTVPPDGEPAGRVLSVMLNLDLAGLRQQKAPPG
jgi:hypothetical protein